jgi:uncharacterized protein (DUF1501 family)
MTGDSGVSTTRACCAELAAVQLSRRTLLAGLLGSAAVPVVGLAGAQVAYADPSDTTWPGDTLVVLSLRGGFDGLSAIVPLASELYADYARLRPGIGIPQNALVALDGTFGMHPAMQPLKALYDSGRFGAVVATGLPCPNRSHFEAMDEMEKAVPGSAPRTGWLGRVLGRHAGALTPLSAVQVGSTTMPMSYLGDHPALGVDALADFTLDGASDDPPFTAARWASALNALHSNASAPVRGAASSALGALGQVATAAAVPAAATYDNNPTAQALADAARLIKSGLGVKLVTLDVGDWDMHAGLGRVDAGWMRDNLTELSRALAAFAADLGPAMDGVTLVTLSEFGRRAGENESGGLDHGWGNAMLVLGGHVAGIRGSWPGLAARNLTDGDLTATTDYRAVLAEILALRCHAAPEDLSAVFPGWTGTPSQYPGVVTT